MTIDAQDLVNSIMASFDRIELIRSEEIPGIDLYVDQVTTFMERKLKNTTRDPARDKILTKTMINNYAKNDLLPPPVRKKYSKEHVLLLIFIYYYKNVLSITDIQTLLKPITEQYFGRSEEPNLQMIYDEVFQLQDEQVERLKADVMEKYKLSEQTFTQTGERMTEKEKEFLQKFSFICLLSFDVYVKKLLIEKVIDTMTPSGDPQTKESRTKEKK
ncbi:MAG: DUF1836 domain-containing protein [Lachnospiraceae bacterium]